MEESMSFSDKGSKLPPLTDEPKKKKKKKKKSRQDREEERDNEGYEDSMNDTAITHMWEANRHNDTVNNHSDSSLTQDNLRLVVIS